MDMLKPLLTDFRYPIGIPGWRSGRYPLQSRPMPHQLWEVDCTDWMLLIGCCFAGMRTILGLLTGTTTRSQPMWKIAESQKLSLVPASPLQVSSIGCGGQNKVRTGRDQ